MRRAVFSASAAMLVAMAGGCTMCASPYDYCGPTETGPCSYECSTARRNSIFAPSGETSMGEEVIYSDSYYDPSAAPNAAPNVAPSAARDAGLGNEPTGGGEIETTAYHRRLPPIEQRWAR